MPHDPGGIRHYKGDHPCPDCGNTAHDPSTGYCPECDGPELALYNVAAFSPEWLAHSEERPPRAPSAVVSGRNVGAQVQRFLPGAQLVVVQQLKY